MQNYGRICNGEKIEQLIQLLEEGIITEDGLSYYSGVTPEQIKKNYKNFSSEGCRSCIKKGNRHIIYSPADCPI